MLLELKPHIYVVGPVGFEKSGLNIVTSIVSWCKEGLGLTHSPYPKTRKKEPPLPPTTCYGLFFWGILAETTKVSLKGTLK